MTGCGKTQTRPDVFAPSFFHQFEDEINRARYEIDEKYHMGQAELRARYLAAGAMEMLRRVTEPESNPMSVTGLQAGAFEAKLAEMKQKMVEKQNASLAKMDSAAETAAAKMEAAANGVVEKFEKGVEEQLAEFAQFTNGGPA